MPSFNRESLLKELKQETTAMIRLIQEQLMPLDDSALNHKPQSNKWSAYECIEHLNLAHAIYFSQLKNIMAKPPITNQKSVFQSGFFGEQMVNTLKPTESGKIKMPMPTFDKADPSKLKSNLSKEVISHLLIQLQDLLAILDKAHEVDWDKEKVTSLLGKILRFKFGDALRFLVAHNQRHLIQAQRAVASFQKSSIS